MNIQKKYRDKNRYLFINNRRTIVVILFVFLTGIFGRFIYSIYEFFPRIDSIDVASIVDAGEEGSAIELMVGESKRIDYVLEGRNTDKFEVQFQSSDETVAIVDESGTIIAIASGRTNITISADNKSYVFHVEVRDSINETSNAKISYRFNKNRIFMGAGVSYNELKILDSSGNLATGIIVDWSFRNPEGKALIASVKNGVITSNSGPGMVGEATVMATVKNSKGIFLQKLEIKVCVEYKSGSKIYALDTQNDTHAGGMSILLQSNKGHYGLIDTGYADEKICTRIVKYLNDLNVKKLNFIVISHYHTDHTGCLKHIVNNVSVENIYIKKYTGSEFGGGLAKSSVYSKKYATWTNYARKLMDAIPKRTKINYITSDKNVGVTLDEMQLLFFNRTDVFGANAIKKKCDYYSVIANSSGNRYDNCNDNTNSLAILLKIVGTERTSYSYFPGDIMNNGVYSEYVNVKGEKIKNAFGWGTNVRFYTNGKWVTQKSGYATYYSKTKHSYEKNNVSIYAEDAAACAIHNVIAKASKNGSVVSCKGSDLENVRNKIRNGKNVFSESSISKIDIYQASHHGLNVSLTTFAYLKPTYAFIPRTEKNTDITDNKFSVLGIKNSGTTGSGTIIYDIALTGKMGQVVKLSDDD